MVGRAVELEELVGRLDEALGGRAGLVLVSGEPGIGKTRLVAELGRLAAARAVPVLWGGCTDEDGAPAFWPWRRILRAWLATASPERVGTLLAGRRGDLARIAPELGPAAPTDGPEQRFALFDTVAGFLTDLAAPTGLVLVLDDVQWADPASRALLTHLARETADARLLMVANYRTAELAGTWLPGAVRLELAWLDEPDVATALADRLGRAPSAGMVATVTRRTRGNPFFVGELGRAWTSDPDASRVPAAVRDVVRRRLARLPDAARALLDVAAVIGREPDLALVAGAAGVTAGDLLDLLRPAVDDGLLERPPGRPGLRFGHDLVRETLLVELAPADRARIHLAAVGVLEPAAGDPDVLPELAHHALAALPLGDAGAACGWTCGAARLATAQLAYEEAARLYGRAQAVGAAVLVPAERIELLLDTARAQALAHDVPAAIGTCTEAAELARRTGDHAALGRAALGMPEVSEAEWLVTVQGWCTEALRGLPGTDSPLRARLLAQLAHCRVLAADRPGMLAASEESLAMAERLDDSSSLVSALRSRQLVFSDADGNAARLVLGGRMLAVAERSGSASDAMWGHLWRFDALLQAGRVAEAEAEVDLLEPIVVALRQPMARLHLLRSRVALAFGRGRFTEAAQLNDESIALALDGGHQGAAATGRSLRFTLAALTGGDPGDVSWFLGNPALEQPFTGLSRASYAQMLVASGRAAEARRWYEGLPGPGSPRIPAFMGMTVEVVRAQLAADLGDAGTAGTCHRLLLPYADLHAVGGAGAITTSGSMHLYLGMAALAAGRPDAAVRHLRTAVTVNDAAGLAPFAALARYRLATALRAGGRALDEAAALAAAAGATADRLGMAPLRAQVDAMASDDGGPLSRREAEIAELVGRGLTNRQIAAAAHISERTVETHVQHVLAKLGFSGRSQIAAWVATRRQ